MSAKNKSLIILLLLLVVIFSCSKFDQNEIIGTWISSDKIDTLDFVDNNNFYNSNITMRYDHYDYHLDKDSIEIRYRGVLMVLVQPTKHKYYLDDNTLTIDFRNKICYGFSSAEITFIKH